MKAEKLQRKIIHIDMDCFYAAVEMRDDKTLKGRPVAVGGDPGRRGVISTANYEARKFGVRSALSSAKAMKLCPHLKIIFPNMGKYSDESRKIRSHFSRFTPLIEPLSLDEAYLDVTGSKDFKGSASLIAREIRNKIYKETGLTASAGIAPNKFLAKVASDWNKPNGQFVITPGEVAYFVERLPVEKIWGVGKVTAKKLQGLGLKTCGDLQKEPLEGLLRTFGKFGKQLFELSRGIDNREVVTSRERKSISVEKTFSEDLTDADKCNERLKGLYADFIFRLERKKGVSLKDVKTLFVKVKFSDFTSTTAERNCEVLSLENYLALLKEGLKRRNLPVRLLGLGVRLHTNKKAIVGPQLDFQF